MRAFFIFARMLRNYLLFIYLFPSVIIAQQAFISGNDTICDNSGKANLRIDFTGTPPFTFVYAINGENQSSINTQESPYFIATSIAGTYTLVNFSDANSLGTVSGSAIVTIIPSPTAIIHLASDTLSIINPIANFISQSTGNIKEWYWDFGDNTLNIGNQSIMHEYSDSSAVYQVSLIVLDNNGCTDTTTRVVFVINNEEDESYWMYTPTSFTPDGDQKNDRFCIEFNSIIENTFLFKVYNSQGSLVYQSNNAKEMECCSPSSLCGWDGTYYKNNNKLPRGTYIYEMYYKELKGWKHKEFGAITLIR